MPSHSAPHTRLGAGLSILLILALVVLPACDGGAPTELGSNLPALAALDGASLAPAPGGGVTALGGGDGAVVARTDGATRFDLAFLPTELAPGRALTSAFITRSGQTLATLGSRPAAGVGHAVSLVPGSLHFDEVTVEARLGGRVVDAVEAVVGTGGAGGGTSLQEPTSVHYYYYQGPDGGWVLGWEYDYDGFGGTTVNLTGGVGPVHADRIRFVVRGVELVDPPDAVRFEGFERLTIIPHTGAFAAR